MDLNLKDVCHSFIPGELIFDKVSLSFPQGKIYVLMGGNGSGKSTLFNVISGFIKPNCGDVILGSLKLTAMSPYRINAAGIGRTFQDLRIIGKLSVRDNIILSMKDNPSENFVNAILPSGFNKKTDQKLNQKATEILNRFFLLEVDAQLASEISYGQQKLLTIACCVANDASILLLDEPVAGIQPEYRQKIVSILKFLKSRGKTLIIIEHNIDFISEVADEILFLNAGTVKRYKDVKALKKDPVVIKSYI